MADLPEWAKSMWEELGSPDLDELKSVHSGDLMERRHGLRKDDLVEIQMDARALREGEETWIRGRLLSSGKSSIELLTTDGDHIYLAREVIVKVVLIAHTRPAYIDDKELLEFERADQKRSQTFMRRSKRKPKVTMTHTYGVD